MKITKVIVLLLFPLLIISGCGPKPPFHQVFSAKDLLSRELDELFSDPAFDTATWGVVIQSLDNGEYLYRRNENKGFMPASNMKLYTTAVSLMKLGPDYRYRTTLLGTGQIENGVLQGDLILHGTGDPSICARFHEEDPLAVFRAWADSLKEKGVTKIAGRIIGDDNYFEDEIMGYGWEWDDQSDYYAAQISAVTFNDNCVDILFAPGEKTGDSARYQLRPNTGFVRIHNRVTTVRPGLETGVVFKRKRAFNDVTISGSIALHSDPGWDSFSVENPTFYAVYVLRELLQKEGIEISGRAFDIDSLKNFHYLPDSATVLASYKSPPLSEIVRTVNKRSQNLYAELLLRTLAKQFTDVGDGPHGVKVVKNVLAQYGIDPDRFGMVDGSGLSRFNLITPMQTSYLLRAMHRHSAGHYYYDSLPIAGVDGTIRGRMRGTAAENNVHAKTGYIGRVRSLSGYVTTRNNEKLSFVMMVNNYFVPTSKANAIQDLVCERLANFSRNLSFK